MYFKQNWKKKLKNHLTTTSRQNSQRRNKVLKTPNDYYYAVILNEVLKIKA